MRIHKETRGLIKLLASFKPKRGELSYRFEGVCEALAEVAPLLKDREKLAGPITKVCERFKLGQENKKSGTFEVSNRFAAAALAALARTEAEHTMPTEDASQPFLPLYGA